MRQAVEQDRQSRREQMQQAAQAAQAGASSTLTRTLSRSRNPSRERTPAEVNDLLLDQAFMDFFSNPFYIL